MVGAAERLTPALTLGLLPHRCATLDRQIDQLVYELYDLTDDEIAIVEWQGAKG